MGGFEGRGAARKAEGVGGAGDVDGLVAALDGDVDGLHAGLEEGDAVASAGNDEGLEFHFGERSAAAAFEFGEIFSVGGGGMEAGAFVAGEAVTRIEGGEERAFFGGKNFAEFLRAGDAEAVVGDG